MARTSHQRKFPVDHPWVALDLDGTIMEDGHYPKLGPPRQGAREAVWRLKQLGLKIMIFTARTQPLNIEGKYTNVNKAVQAILDWGVEYDIPIDYVFPLPKPTFVVAFFDDRAIRVDEGFEGWDAAIREFEHHYKDKIKGDWARAVLPPHLTGGSRGRTKRS